MPTSEAQKKATKKWKAANCEKVRERARIRAYEKYHNDDEWKAKKKAREKTYYYAKKLRTADLSQETVVEQMNGNES